MATASVEIPKRATAEDVFAGTWEGDTLYVTLYAGHASDGYKSDFERRPARWILWERYDASGKRTVRRATRYGGRRYGKAAADFAECVRQLRAAGVA